MRQAYRHLRISLVAVLMLLAYPLQGLRAQQTYTDPRAHWPGVVQRVCAWYPSEKDKKDIKKGAKTGNKYYLYAMAIIEDQKNSKNWKKHGKAVYDAFQKALAAGFKVSEMNPKNIEENSLIGTLVFHAPAPEWVTYAEMDPFFYDKLAKAYDPNCAYELIPKDLEKALYWYYKDIEEYGKSFLENGTNSVISKYSLDNYTKIYQAKALCEKQFKAEQRANPTSALGCYLIAQETYEAGQYNIACAWAERSLGFKADDAKVRKFYALCLARSGQTDKAIDEYKALGNAGDKQSLTQAGLLLLAQPATAKKNQGIQLLNSAAQDGSGEAAYKLGLCYREGFPVTANRQKAIEYLRMAQRNNYDKADTALNEIYPDVSTRQRTGSVYVQRKVVASNSNSNYNRRGPANTNNNSRSNNNTAYTSRETGQVSLPSYGNIPTGITVVCYRADNGDEVKLTVSTYGGNNHISLSITNMLGLIYSQLVSPSSIKNDGNNFVIPGSQIIPGVTMFATPTLYIARDWRSIKLSSNSNLYNTPIATSIFEQHKKNFDENSKRLGLFNYDPRMNQGGSGGGTFDAINNRLEELDSNINATRKAELQHYERRAAEERNRKVDIKKYKHSYTGNDAMEWCEQCQKWDIPHWHEQK